MRRRQVLATIGATLPFAGCLGSVSGDGPVGGSRRPTTEPGVDITVPIVSRGTTAPITINAQSVIHLRFSEVANIAATVEYEDAAFSPPPDVIWQANPPTWQWSPRESVTGNVPLTVSETVEPGDYQYAIAVEQAGSETEVISTFTVAIQG